MVEVYFFWEKPKAQPRAMTLIPKVVFKVVVNQHVPKRYKEKYTCREYLRGILETYDL